ncbi:MAG: PAS domain-containing sensor histidine kinase [Candidatus Kapabacteria bacterium]|jgi:PAS domain S-box-containing protein|nr:PAS domain-containing sensor histidine kinase [Candidatus Kapabacteria bacterium]
MDFPFQQYFESMPCYLTVQDRDLKVILANNKFVSDFGNYKGRYCYQVYKNSPMKCEYCAVEKTFHDGIPRSSEEQVQSLDGTDVSVLINTTPIRDKKGAIIAVMEMSTDVTEIKELQKQSKENHDRYKLLFEEVPCYLSIQDKDLNIINSNRLHKEKFGNNLGLKCYEVYKHRSEECFPCIVRQTFEDGEIHYHEETVTTKDGTCMNCLVHSAPIRDAEGNITKVIEMSTNISELRDLQDQLSSIGLLISSISHGIKGLLNGLNGGIYLVNKGIANDNKDRLEQGWEIVLRNVDRIKSMVMDILYYAKDREPNWEHISALDLAKESFNVVQTKAENLGIEFDSDFDNNTGAFDCDRNALRSMLVNLLENSLDACRVDKSKENHSVKFGLSRTKDDVQFIIQDNGIGMDQETREKAFSLFFSSKGGDGTGLGLFIANKITTAHGGKIDIETEPFKGCKFTVSIPRRSVALSSRDFK